MNVRIITGLLVGMVLLMGCSRRRVIPDDKLVKILKEIYLNNAYASQYGLKADSLDVYMPVLKKYGYRPRDLNYTFNEFSKRKSSRISDIIEATSAELDRELQWFTRRVATLDTINLIARERFKQVIYTDSLIYVRKISDTAKLRINLPATVGTYHIRYGYQVDSTDRNMNLRTTHFLLDSAGRQLTSNVNWMQKHSSEHQRYTAELNAISAARRLEIRFGNYGKEMTTPRIRIDSLIITFYLPLEQALDSLRRHLYEYRPVIDGTEYSNDAPNRGALSLLPPRMDQKRDSIP